jgi:Protein of unknown function (DUF1566)
MSKTMPRLEAVLMVAMIAVWMGSWGTLASAASKKAPAPVPQTGADQSFSPGDDAALQAGVPFPTPRFTDNRNGTVTDNLTGLIWLKLSYCFGTLFWKPAIAAVNQLASGQCDLADGSVAGDWRLPNVRELLSLLDYGFSFPALSNAAGTGQAMEGDPFVGITRFAVVIEAYWTSTFAPGGGGTPGAAWLVDIIFGQVGFDSQTNDHGVWAVRGGK